MTRAFVIVAESCGPALTAHGSLDLKQEIQIQIQMQSLNTKSQPSNVYCSLRIKTFIISNIKTTARSAYLRICNEDR
jgi:hypothetical protein